MPEVISSPAIQSSVQLEVSKQLKSQREFFRTGITKEIDFRVTQLKKLKAAILKNEKGILAALKTDLNKSAFESYGTEIGMVLNEIDKCIKEVRKWSKPKKVKTPLFHFKGSSYIYSDPYGLVLIVGPWNYPFQLLMLPLAGAIAAGNVVCLKPSEISPATSAIMTKIVKETFDEQFVSIFEGGIDVSQALLGEKHDYIFFTGSTNVGRIVYQAAAKNLTPVTLELGGKSPCIVDKDLDLETSAKRIAWGKLVNCGQTCIAPDYLLVHESVKDQLVEKLIKHFEGFYGKDASKSNDYGRIISERHFKRLTNLMQDGKVVYGGKTDISEKYISPTLIDMATDEDQIMKEEIFGPILPIKTYSNIEDAIKYINDRPKPLALYCFSKNQSLINRVLKETTSGGSCINDTLMHIGNDHLPFGGVGESGIGNYHGESSFDTFSHKKSVMHKSTAIDPYVRYAPYKLSLGILKTVLSKFN